VDTPFARTLATSFAKKPETFFVVPHACET
jgi:hypothetical protein